MTLTLDVGCGSRSRGDVNVDLLIEESDPHRFNVHSVSNLVVADAHYLPFKKDAFSKVFCFHLMEHIKKDYQVFGELDRVSNGVIEIRVPLGIWEDLVNRILFWKWIKTWREKHHVRRYTKQILKESFKNSFKKKRVKIRYGYAGIVSVLKFVKALITNQLPSPPQSYMIRFPFPYEIIATITED